MSEPSHQPADFSLVRGGPLSRIDERLGLARAGLSRPGVSAAIAVGVGFLPLIVLAVIEGVLTGDRVTLSLLKDWTVPVRFLLAVPLLILAEGPIDARLAGTVRHFRTCGILEGGAQANFEVAVRKVERARDSLLPEIILLVAALGFAWLSGQSASIPMSSWRQVVPGQPATITVAGKWAALVSQPIFGFLLLRWLWRIALWGRLLVRVSRLHLKLVPTHADGAGGLGFLGDTHTTFAWFLIPISLALAARGVLLVQYGGWTLDGLRNSLIAYVVIALAIVLGPLLVFLPKLTRAKYAGLFEYGLLAGAYAIRFDEKWLRGGGVERRDELLGTGDIQSLADMRGSFAIVTGMRVVPLTLANTVILALAAVLPMLPLLAAIYPVEQTLNQVLQLLLR